MAPRACPLSHAGSAFGSSAHRGQDSGKGQRKGGGKGGNKGTRGQDPTLRQLGHLAPQAKAMQSSAAALGWTISFTPKGGGKWRNDNNPNRNPNTKSAATKVFLQDLQA